MVTSVARVVIAKKQVEIAKARSGENALQVIITCIEVAMRPTSYTDGTLVEEREFKQLTVGDQAWQRSPIRSMRIALWVLCTWAVASPWAVQRLTRRCSYSSSGRIIRCGCQFYAEPVHGAC